ncbi:MAG: CDP-alcohol phosphatidyltransferase family protein [Candidatus Aenigmatarchaeota archaeon]
MTLYKKRKKFDSHSKKLGSFFSKFGLSPNQWTMVGFIPAIITAYFLYVGSLSLAALFFIITIVVDVIDGSVARHMGKSTKLGAYLDTVVDRYVELIIIIGLLFVSMPVILLPMYAWIFLFLFGSMMTTYVKAAAVEKGLTTKEIKGGLLERTDRMVILLIGLLLGIVNPLYLSYVIILLAILTNISALQRFSIATS